MKCDFNPCRWQAQNGQKEAAFEQLKYVAKVNGRSLDAAAEAKIQSILNRIEEEAEQGHEEQLSPLDMFRKGQALT